jgi:uncharacterized protein involved in exopolysaccharide biosynthesis
MMTNGQRTERELDTFDGRAALVSIVGAARHHRGLLVMMCVFTLGLVTLYAVIWPPTYEATATLMVERDTDPVRDSFYIGWNVFRKDDARTEIELIMSGPVLKEVVEREKLTYEDVYHPFTSHLTYLWEQSSIGQTYRRLKRQFLGDDTSGAPSQDELTLGRTIVDMRAGIALEPVAESNVGRLHVKGPSRRVAAIANAITDVYLERRADRYQAEAQKAYDVLSEEVKRAGDELSTIEERRLAIAEGNTLAFDFQKESLEVQKLTDLEENIATTRTRLAAIDASLTEISGQLANDPPTRASSGIREATRMKRMEVETALIEARLRYREDSPEIQGYKTALAELDAMIDQGTRPSARITSDGLSSIQQDLVTRQNALRAERMGAQAGLRVMEATAASLRSRLSGVPAKQAELRTVDREYALSQEKYKELLAKQAQAAVSVATARTTMSSMRVVEYAVPPADKAWPRLKILYPASLAVALILGLAVAVFKSYTDGRVRLGIVEHGRVPLPVYGTLVIPRGDRALVAVRQAPPLEARKIEKDNHE